MGLTKTQLEIVYEMRDGADLLLVFPLGSGVSTWELHRRGQFLRKVTKSTVQSLRRKGVIEFVSQDIKVHKYGLSSNYTGSGDV